MNDCIANAMPLLPGARSAPVGTPSGISDASSAKFGMNRAGNSVAAECRRSTRELSPFSPNDDEVVAPRDELAARVDPALEDSGSRPGR